MDCGLSLFLILIGLSYMFFSNGLFFVGSMLEGVKQEVGQEGAKKYKLKSWT